VVLPPALIADRAKLSEWAAKSFEYARSLPTKTARTKSAKGKAAVKKRSR
jgi:hypothetical protein